MRPLALPLRYTLLLPALLLLAAGCDAAEPSLEEPSEEPSEPKLISQSLERLPHYNLYRIGAADLDGDGREDLWALAHNARSMLLKSAGEGFEVMAEITHEPEFPALHDRPTAPTVPSGRAILYWRRKALHVRSGPQADSVKGTLTLRAAPKRLRAARPKVTRAIRTSVSAGPGVSVGKSALNGAAATSGIALKETSGATWTVRFALAPGGHLEVTGRDHPIAGFPVDLKLRTDPQKFSVGRTDARLSSKKETLRLRDYHALAAKDVNGDGRKDPSFFGGGLRGNASRIVPNAKETMLISSGDGYERREGPPKLGCASRSAQWNGGRLRVTCARGRTDNVWRFVGESWRGGRASEETQPPDPLEVCRSSEFAQEGYVSPKEGDLCAEGDFDGDDQKELVVASPKGDLLYETTLYNLKHI